MVKTVSYFPFQNEFEIETIWKVKDSRLSTLVHSILKLSVEQINDLKLLGEGFIFKLLT